MSFLKEYTLLGELGKGAFAKVYKVRHNTLEYIRAIRVLNELVTDENSPIYQKFLRECKVLLRLGNGNHPNIVHIYQPRFLENHALVEMDYVDGKNISQYLNDNENFLPVEEVLQMAKEVSSALAYCHEDIYKFCLDPDKDDLKNDPVDGTKWVIDETKQAQLIKKYGVIHNDIHSCNIMRRENGSFVLLDFGLAITGDDDVRNSSRHENGAVEFKAPEKWEDDSVLTTQSDIYSFGVVMYEYLAGRVPFPYDKSISNKDRANFMLGEAHKKQTPPPIFDIRKSHFEAKHPGLVYEKDYPDWLEKLIMKCLEKDPSNRFRNGKELNRYIEDYLCKSNVLEKDGKKRQETNNDDPYNDPTNAQNNDTLKKHIGHIAMQENELVRLRSKERQLEQLKKTRIWSLVALVSLALSCAVFAWLYFTSSENEKRQLPVITKGWAMDFIEGYHQNIKDGDFEQMAAKYAPHVERYFNLKDVSREAVIENKKNTKTNDKDVEWVYDWNSLQVKDVGGGRKEVVFSSVFQRKSGYGKGYYNLTTNLTFNEKGQIVSAYDSKSEKL